MKPFLICPPRTRSSIVYECLAPYVHENTDLLPLIGHSEPFLHTVQNRTVFDHTISQNCLTEMYPIMTDKAMTMHYIYPWVFKNNKTSILEKLKMLQTARDNGNEYFIKGTYNIAEAINEVLEFFSDYDVTITLRRNVLDLVCSMLFATHSKMFHKRIGNSALYDKKLKEGVTITQEAIDQFKPFLDKLKVIYQIPDRLPSANIVYYEDTDTEEKLDAAITKIAGNEDWKKYKLSHVPIKLNNDYSKLIRNYDQVVTLLKPMIDF